MSTCLLFTGTGAASLGQQKNELESELASLKNLSAELKTQYQNALKEANDQQKTVNVLYDQIDTYQQQLETVSALIEEYTALASEKEKEIDRLNEQMNRNFQLFKERLVFAQESGNMSYIDFILGSSDLSDIISRSEVINDMLEYDRKIIEGLIADRDQIQKAKEEIDLALQNCESKKSEYESILAELEAKRAEANQLLATLKDDVTASQTALNRVEANKKNIEKRLDEVIKEIARQSELQFSGSFRWPLPYTTPGYISQYFKGSAHSGLDIAVGGWANNGKIPALSIADGKVVRRGSYSDWGNLIVVDHGGGYLSYYAHLDSMSVSVGQMVKQGQQVGKIGSTGQSTGPHLHLVIYAPIGTNGESVRDDPMKYISYPR
jgi:murein DD-endopeptidase MepM/ murein hydrolase activator NlpD